MYVLNLECIRLMYMWETIKYNTVEPVIYLAQFLITVATQLFTFSYI